MEVSKCWVTSTVGEWKKRCYEYLTGLLFLKVALYLGLWEFPNILIGNTPCVRVNICWIQTDWWLRIHQEASIYGIVISLYLYFIAFEGLQDFAIVIWQNTSLRLFAVCWSFARPHYRYGLCREGFKNKLLVIENETFLLNKKSNLQTIAKRIAFDWNGDFAWNLIVSIECVIVA